MGDDVHPDAARRGTRGKGTPPTGDSILIPLEIPADKLQAAREEVRAFVEGVADRMGGRRPNPPTKAYLVFRPLLTELNKTLNGRQ